MTTEDKEIYIELLHEESKLKAQLMDLQRQRLAVWKGQFKNTKEVDEDSRLIGNSRMPRLSFQERMKQVLKNL